MNWKETLNYTARSGWGAGLLAWKTGGRMQRTDVNKLTCSSRPIQGCEGGKTRRVLPSGRRVYQARNGDGENWVFIVGGGNKKASINLMGPEGRNKIKNFKKTTACANRTQGIRPNCQCFGRGVDASGDHWAVKREGEKSGK